MFQLVVGRLLADWPALAKLGSIDKITSRAALAALAAFALTVTCGPRWIGWLRRRFREPIKIPSSEVAKLHQAKQFTPTMGGLFLVGGLIVGALVFADWSNPYIVVAVAMTLALGALGAWDDWIKLSSDARGLKASTKLACQSGIAVATAALVYRAHDNPALAVPVLGNISLGYGFVPLAAVVIVSASNAVNLTDGLDGLAGGCLICATAAVAIVVYAAGHAGWAAYLGIPHVTGAGETVVIAAGMIGGLLGFLWFNCHPASVFMGDTGSLPLGGLLGLLVVIARQELLLLAIGGVFVVEAASVIVQVAAFRCTGRRVFRCAPLHHHFQLAGWPEDKIVVRFWIAAALCAVVGLSALKLGGSEGAATGPARLAAQVGNPSHVGQDIDEMNELSMRAACLSP